VESLEHEPKVKAPGRDKKQTFVFPNLFDLHFLLRCTCAVSRSKKGAFIGWRFTRDKRLPVAT
jgi:hypothetical protein